MPRKQRFKPSRKPKPMPPMQAQEAADLESLERSSAQRDAARVPEAERPEHAAEARSQGRDEAQAS